MKTVQKLRTQTIARVNQKYDPSPLQKTCVNCIHYSSEYVQDRWGNMEEKKLRCKLGGFAIKKKGTCCEHRFNEQNRSYRSGNEYAGTSSKV